MVTKDSNSGILASISQFVAWVVAVLLALVDVIAIREALLSLLALFRVYENAAYRKAGGVGDDIFTGFGITAFDMFTMFIMGGVAIVMVIVIEYYFRKGRVRGLLYQRIGKVLGIEVAIVAVAILIRTIAASILQTTPPM